MQGNSAKTAIDTENHPKSRKMASKKSKSVLQAARSTFLELGYDRTSMDTIAQGAGVSKATVYAHFESKEALFSRLIEEEFALSGDDRLWDSSLPIVDIEADLRTIARNFTRCFLNDKGLAFHRLIVSNASRFPEIAEIFMKAGPRKQRAEVGAFFERAVDEGFLRIADMDLAVKQFLSLVQCDLPLNWALSMKPPPQSQYDALIEGGVRIFLAAYGVKKNGADS